MYVKIFDSIIKSSIWDTDPETRITWITCLLLCDLNGNFTATRRYIAREANLPLDRVEAALDVLLNPDTDSTTPDDEGRRLDYCGNNTWHVVNYAKYNEIAKAETVREQTRKRVKLFSDRKKQASVSLTQTNAELTRPNAELTPITAPVAVTTTVTPVATVIGSKDPREVEPVEKPEKKKSIQPEVQATFEFWTQVMEKPGAKLSPKRKARIEWALKEYGNDRARKAIIGCASSAFHMGENEQGKRFDDLELIFRNSEKFESFEALGEKARTYLDAVTGFTVVAVTPPDEKARAGRNPVAAERPHPFFDNKGQEFGIVKMMRRRAEEEARKEAERNANQGVIIDAE